MSSLTTHTNQRRCLPLTDFLDRHTPYLYLLWHHRFQIACLQCHTSSLRARNDSRCEKEKKESLPYFFGAHCLYMWNMELFWCPLYHVEHSWCTLYIMKLYGLAKACDCIVHWYNCCGVTYSSCGNLRPRPASLYCHTSSRRARNDRSCEEKT